MQSQKTLHPDKIYYSFLCFNTGEKLLNSIDRTCFVRTVTLDKEFVSVIKSNAHHTHDGLCIYLSLAGLDIDYAVELAGLLNQKSYRTSGEILRKFNIYGSGNHNNTPQPHLPQESAKLLRKVNFPQYMAAPQPPYYLFCRAISLSLKSL